MFEPQRGPGAAARQQGGARFKEQFGVALTTQSKLNLH